MGKSRKLPKIGISAIGVYEPPWVLRNDWFAAILPAKFVKHTGIEARRISLDDEVAMAVRAVENLQRETGLRLGDCAGVVFTASSLAAGRRRAKNIAPPRAAGASGPRGAAVHPPRGLATVPSGGRSTGDAAAMPRPWRSCGGASCPSIALQKNQFRPGRDGQSHEQHPRLFVQANGRPVRRFCPGDDAGPQ